MIDTTKLRELAQKPSEEVLWELMQENNSSQRCARNNNPARSGGLNLFWSGNDPGRT